MAMRQILADDITGVEGDVETVTFTFEGTSYSIDLGPDNRARLAEALAPFIGHARRGSNSHKAPGKRPVRSGNAAVIRMWARENGYSVPERGRIPADIHAAYAAAVAV